MSPAPSQTLTAPEFHQLAQVPPAAEGFANIDNPGTLKYARAIETQSRPNELGRVPKLP